jgi:hypothetical protein
MARSSPTRLPDKKLFTWRSSSGTGDESSGQTIDNLGENAIGLEGIYMNLEVSIGLCDEF